MDQVGLKILTGEIFFFRIGSIRIITTLSESFLAQLVFRNFQSQNSELFFYQGSDLLQGSYPLNKPNSSCLSSKFQLRNVGKRRNLSFLNIRLCTKFEFLLNQLFNYRVLPKNYFHSRLHIHIYYRHFTIPAIAFLNSFTN